MRSKFVTVTRKALHQLPIADRSKEALAVLEKYMLRDEGKQGAPMASISAPCSKSYLKDDEVIVKAHSNLKTGAKFASLWNGDTSAYGGDKSKADMALSCLLCFWCNRDAAQMDRLFRQSGLMRAKWEAQRGAQTYGSMTIQRAIATCKAGYTTEWKG